MDLHSTMKFGEGPRELSGSSDLINQYKLLHHYEFFCKKSLSPSIYETRYLHNVVGDREIRKGEGMELDQLFRNGPHLREDNASIHHFDLGVLMEAFRMRQTTNIILPSGEKGISSTVEKPKNECKVKQRKHKRHRDKIKEEKGHKKHKHHNNISSKKDEQSGIRSGPETLKTHHDKVLTPMFRT